MSDIVVNGGTALPALMSVPPVYRDRPNLETGKNIVVCADGTGNADVKGRGSNVFKTFEAVDTTSHQYRLDVPRQIAFYDEGVGTENWWPRRVLGGAVGWGLGANVCELYAEIARVYRPGDRLYVFGFSRGAFTAWALADLVDCCGILEGAAYPTRSALTADVRRCYRNYLRKLPTDDLGFHERADRPIEFLGLWDTVDAVGLSFKASAERLNRRRPFKPALSGVPSSVRYACQALALDDERIAFTPELLPDGPNVEQVWFAGVHSDIGGGYPRQGLSLVPLHWMMARAEARGLRFVPSDRAYYAEHQVVADRLHDSRGGAAVYYRWKPRDVSALSAAAGVRPHVHITVFDRIAQGVDGYAPLNIPPDAVTAFTERRDWRYLEPARIQEALWAHGESLGSAARSCMPVVERGVRSYWRFVAGSALTVLSTAALLMAWLLSGTPWPPAWWGTAAGGTTLRVGLPLVVVGLLLVGSAWRASRDTDRQLEALFSGVWHRVRPDLAGALARSSPDAARRARGGVADRTLAGRSDVVAAVAMPRVSSPPEPDAA